MTRMQDMTLDRDNSHALARGLGWFSLGLGAAELFAPKALSRWLGMKDGEWLLRSYGAREIAAGVGILVADRPAPWVWSRVAGDVVDVATLLNGIRHDNPKNGNIGLAVAAVLGVTLADVACASSLDARDREHRRRQRYWVDAYRRRSGYREPARAMRGAARDFETPDDMRAPEALRAYGTAGTSGTDTVAAAPGLP